MLDGRWVADGTWALENRRDFEQHHAIRCADSSGAHQPPVLLLYYILLMCLAYGESLALVAKMGMVRWRLAAEDRRMMASPGSGGGSHWQATPIAIAVAEDGVGRSWIKLT